jgi:hypothetical protein
MLKPSKGVSHQSHGEHEAIQSQEAKGVPGLTNNSMIKAEWASWPQDDLIMIATVDAGS